MRRKAKTLADAYERNQGLIGFSYGLFVGRHQAADQDDIKQELSIRLLDCIQKHDAEKGRLSSYTIPAMHRAYCRWRRRAAYWRGRNCSNPRRRYLVLFSEVGHNFHLAKAPAFIDHRCDPTEREKEQAEYKSRVATMLELLNDRDKFIIRNRYGIGCRSSTLDAVAQSIGISRERVRQLEIKAMMKLRRHGASQ